MTTTTMTTTTTEREAAFRDLVATWSRAEKLRMMRAWGFTAHGLRGAALDDGLMLAWRRAQAERAK